MLAQCSKSAGEAKLNAQLKGRPNRLGIYLAALYLLLVAIAFAFGALNNNPDNLGYNVPVFVLCVPWSLIRAHIFLPGWLLNATIIYLLGTLSDSLRRRAFQK
jgi:hypothetical protein